jgi:hypothetical protein
VCPLLLLLILTRLLLLLEFLCVWFRSPAECAALFGGGGDSGRNLRLDQIV